MENPGKGGESVGFDEDSAEKRGRLGWDGGVEGGCFPVSTGPASSEPVQASRFLFPAFWGLGIELGLEDAVQVVGDFGVPLDHVAFFEVVFAQGVELVLAVFELTEFPAVFVDDDTLHVSAAADKDPVVCWSGLAEQGGQIGEAVFVL